MTSTFHQGGPETQDNCIIELNLALTSRTIHNTNRNETRQMIQVHYGKGLSYSDMAPPSLTRYGYFNCTV